MCCKDPVSTPPPCPLRCRVRDHQHRVATISGFIPRPIPNTHSSPLATPPDISCPSFFSCTFYGPCSWGCTFHAVHCFLHWGVGSRTRFWWLRLTCLILGIYNLQGLDVAGLLSGPQPSSNTLPNLSLFCRSCRFFTFTVKRVILGKGALPLFFYTSRLV